MQQEFGAPIAFVARLNTRSLTPQVTLDKPPALLHLNNSFSIFACIFHHAPAQAPKMTTRSRRIAPAPKLEKLHGNVKVTKERWLECAKQMLVEDGIGALKADRLARRLKITRGAFYHNFKNVKEFEHELLEYWRQTNRFIADDMDLSTPRSARKALSDTAAELIKETHFDPQFDLAVREWARISKPVASVVSATDENRLRELRAIFEALGYPRPRAQIRAKIFYMHQIGYYSLGMVESVKEREENADLYLDVLGGTLFRKEQLAA